MTATTLPRHPFLEFSGVRWRLWPVLLAAVLMQAVLWPARELARWIAHQQADIVPLLGQYGRGESVQKAAEFGKQRHADILAESRNKLLAERRARCPHSA